MARRIRLVATGLLVVTLGALGIYAVQSIVLQPPPPLGGRPMPPSREAFALEGGNLPVKFVSAAEVLFEQGLADPHGGEYREVTVPIKSDWTAKDGTASTHGWLLPSQGQGKQRLAVCWNGLLYPALSIGQPADVRNDIEAALKEDREYVDLQLRYHEEEMQRAAAAGEEVSETSVDVRLSWTCTEAWSVNFACMYPLKAVLLLRLGHHDLADRLWRQWHAGEPDKVEKDPYLELADAWTWALFDRALDAHRHGDDALALESARLLATTLPELRDIAVDRGLEQDENGRDLSHCFPNLDEVAELLKDQERRSRTRRQEPTVALDKVQKEQDPSQRIAGLIALLDEISPSYYGYGGSSYLEGDPIVHALIEEGDAAVEPLIVCFESDDRLTRSENIYVDFSGSSHYSRSRRIIPVYEEAATALDEILKETFAFRGYGEDPQAVRRESAKQWRDYWQKYQGVPLAERWYRELNADDGNWIRSAWKMVERDPDGNMAGESLREKHGPAVGELLARRMRELATKGRGHDYESLGLDQAGNLARCLAKWDGISRLEDLRWFTEYADSRMKGHTWGNIVRTIVAIYDLRHEFGDTSALDEYGKWVVTVSPAEMNNDPTAIFELMVNYPDHEAIRAAAEWLFTAPNSPWVSVLETRWGSSINDLSESQYLRLPSYRRYVLKELHNHAPVGMVRPQNSWQMLNIEVKHVATGGTSAHLDDPLRPQTDEPIEFRVCDLFANKLTGIEGTPNCQLYWPQENRDAAVQELIDYLNRFGDRLDPTPVLFGGMLSFPDLGRPATAEDVKQGLAIFSLDDAEQVRHWKLPRVPMDAKWVTNKDDPWVVQTFEVETGSSAAEKIYVQKGKVWQAEEVFENGRWQRYYGFVGPHCVVRVPAEEIEFPDSSWHQLSEAVDYLVTGQPQGEQASDLQVGDPCQVMIKFRNRQGSDLALPIAFYRDAPNKMLAKGFQLHLKHTTEDFDPFHFFKVPSQDRTWGCQPSSWFSYYPLDASTEVQWTPMKSKKSTRTFDPHEQTAVVRAGTEFAPFDLDLTDWFEIHEPGWYQFYFNYDDGSGAAPTESYPVNFHITDSTKW